MGQGVTRMVKLQHLKRNIFCGLWIVWNVIL